MKKHLIDFTLVLIFFVAYFVSKDFLVATLTLLAAATVQIIISRVFFGKIEQMQLILFAVLAVACLLTLLFKDERFLKWKPTIVNWAFATALLTSYHFFNKNWIKTILEAAVKSNDDIQFDAEEIPWKRINLYASIFFILVGGINLWVAYTFSTNTWVQFRLFGLMGLNLLGVIALMISLFPHIEATEKKEQNQDPLKDRGADKNQNIEITDTK